ncbi:MAG: type II toxin-antitoxin system prevent-host-death family antitoxin [Spirochaetales bacterium]|nr:type II toxin-antitoxin system prevent-host-death family antitoxin [Spirochaetales bacterium]
MNAVNYSELRTNLKSYMDTVYEDHEPLIITRKNNENLVMISIEDYNSMIETDYLLSSEKNAEHLIRSLENSRKGITVEKDLIEP